MEDAEKMHEKEENGDKQIKICPKCGSTDISWDAQSTGVARVFMNISSCNNCGLKGKFPTINISKVEEFRRALNKR